jgi:hypothetical protein
MWRYATRAENVRVSELKRKAEINGFARKIARQNEDVRRKEQMRGTGVENSRNTQSVQYKYSWTGLLLRD